METPNSTFSFIVLAFLTLVNLSAAELYPSSCAELLVEGNTKSGLYTIQPRAWFGECKFKVYCDMEMEGGGWTVFQKRDDYEIHENFYRNWRDYKEGFGDLEKEFWLGNDKIFVLSNQDRVSIRIELEDFEENTRFAEYENFQMTNEINNYSFNVSGYKGNAGNAFYQHSGKAFVTFDKNDVNECSRRTKGGWWYHNCHHANLNGLYLRGANTTYAVGINWGQWLGNNYSLKRTEMKVRPANFAPHWTFKRE